MWSQSTAPSQQEEAAPPPKDQFFTGTVTKIDDTAITVARTVLGKASTTKTFEITPDTKFEGGKPRAHLRVTVRFVSTEDGDRAVHIIVRSTARAPKK